MVIAVSISATCLLAMVANVATATLLADCTSDTDCTGVNVECAPFRGSRQQLNQLYAGNQLLVGRSYLPANNNNYSPHTATLVGSDHSSVVGQLSIPNNYGVVGASPAAAGHHHYGLHGDGGYGQSVATATFPQNSPPSAPGSNNRGGPSFETPGQASKSGQVDYTDAATHRHRHGTHHTQSQSNRRTHQVNRHEHTIQQVHRQHQHTHLHPHHVHTHNRHHHHHVRQEHLTNVRPVHVPILHQHVHPTNERRETNSFSQSKSEHRFHQQLNPEFRPAVHHRRQRRNVEARQTPLMVCLCKVSYVPAANGCACPPGQSASGAHNFGLCE